MIELSQKILREDVSPAYYRIFEQLPEYTKEKLNFQYILGMSRERCEALIREASDFIKSYGNMLSFPYSTIEFSSTSSKLDHKLMMKSQKIYCDDEYGMLEYRITGKRYLTYLFDDDLLLTNIRLLLSLDRKDFRKRPFYGFLTSTRIDVRPAQSLYVSELIRHGLGGYDETADLDPIYIRKAKAMRYIGLVYGFNEHMQNKIVEELTPIVTTGNNKVLFLKQEIEALIAGNNDYLRFKKKVPMQAVN